MKSRLIIFSTFALLFSACATPATPLLSTPTIAPPIETELSTTEALPTSEPTQPPLRVEPSPTNQTMPAMTTYTDTFAGFSLDYPANWFLESSALLHAEESTIYSVGIASWDIVHPAESTGKQANSLPPGGTKIDVGVLKQPMTLEEAVAQLSEADGPILARNDVTLAGGLPGVILDFEGFAGLTRTLITILNENVIYVTGYGNLENFESIALTLRPK